MTEVEGPGNRILEVALDLADKGSWEALRLYDLARTLGISLEQVYEHYQQKDDLVEAWYDRADRAMLRVAEKREFLQQDMQTRLHELIMGWLDTLAEYKQVSSDMLLYKMEPGHIHLQVLGVLRISRTVQWFREAAQQDSTHFHRILEEVGLTSIYLATFAYWIFDKSENQKSTRDFLSRKLEQLKSPATFLNEFFRSGIRENREVTI